MRLRDVLTPADEEAFLRAALHPLAALPDEAVRVVFDPRRNGYFDAGAARRWLLEDEHGAPLGRVAAFYRRKPGVPLTGGMGFFTCVDDDAAAGALFSAAEDWLRAQGAVSVDGPINFGERDRMWGLLVSGLEPPVFLDPWNPPSYVGLFERAGWVPVMESLSYSVDAQALDLLALRAASAPRETGRALEFAHLRELGSQRFAEGMAHVYGAAFSAAGRPRHWSAAELAGWLAADTTVDPDWMWLAFLGDEPVALLGYQPDLNQRPGRIDRLKGFVTAVHPAHQGTGLLLALGTRLHEALAAAGMREVLMTGIAGHSPRIRAIVERFGGRITRVHATWRKALQPGVPITPFPMPVWGDARAVVQEVSA